MLVRICVCVFPLNNIPHCLIAFPLLTVAYFYIEQSMNVIKPQFSYL